MHVERLWLSLATARAMRPTAVRGRVSTSLTPSVPRSARPFGKPGTWRRCRRPRTALIAPPSSTVMPHAAFAQCDEPAGRTPTPLSSAEQHGTRRPQPSLTRFSTARTGCRAPCRQGPRPQTIRRRCVLRTVYAHSFPGRPRDHVVVATGPPSHRQVLDHRLPELPDPLKGQVLVQLRVRSATRREGDASVRPWPRSWEPDRGQAVGHARARRGCVHRWR